MPNAVRGKIDGPAAPVCEMSGPMPCEPARNRPPASMSIELAVEVIAPDQDGTASGQRDFDPGLEQSRAVVGVDVADRLQVADLEFREAAAVNVLRGQVQRVLAARKREGVVERQFDQPQVPVAVVESAARDRGEVAGPGGADFPGPGRCRRGAEDCDNCRRPRRAKRFEGRNRGPTRGCCSHRHLCLSGQRCQA